MSSESVDPAASTPASPETVSSTPSASTAEASSPEGGESRLDPSRFKIGSQRPKSTTVESKAEPKPNVVKPATTVVSKGPAFDAHAPKKFPPPTTRGQLSADLEVEYAEALAGMSFDDIVASGVTGSQEVDLEPESRLTGRVVSVHRESVFLDLGGHKQGILPLKLFSENPEVGSELKVMVSRFSPAEGLYELVLPGGTVEVADWSEINEGMVVEARITGHNKGGLECDVNRIRGFIPAGQVSLYRVEDLSQFVDQKLPCVVTEANPNKGNLVLSHRAVLEREKAAAREKLLAELEVGQVREGIVRSLQEFGAFVDIGGIDGLIHISQLSWDRIRHAKEVLEVGQTVKVKIQKIDPVTGKIGLAFRDLSENPWADAPRKFSPRSRVNGTVSRLMDFGAFVRLEAGVEGLIHVSEISHKRVWRPSDVLAEGQAVEVLVLSVDPEQQRMSLSLKALETKATPTAVEEPEEEPAAPPVVVKRKTPLKGGVTRPSGGDKFGLNW